MLRGVIRRTTAGCLFLLCVAAASSARQSSEPQASRILHWGASGQYAKQVNFIGMPVASDVVFFYEHEFGKYPRFWNGVAENGGTPYRASLGTHLAKVRTDIVKKINYTYWRGFGVIDFESWHPLWDLSPQAFRTGAVQQTMRENPALTQSQATTLARTRHEIAAKEFMLQTIAVCKEVRPLASWGFFNMPADGQSPWVSSTPWLWEASTAFFPAVSVDRFGVASGVPGPGQGTVAAYRAHVQRAVSLARSVAAGKPVLAVGWLRYPDFNPYYKFQFLSDLDLWELLNHQRLMGADGLIFWDYIGDPSLVLPYSRYVQVNLRAAVERLVAEDPLWHYLLGDADSDGSVNYNDIFACLSAWGADYRPLTGFGDADRNGLVEFKDVLSVTTNLVP